MINKKVNKLLSSILGIALTIGIMETPALANDNVKDVSAYAPSISSDQSKSYIVSKDNYIEKNGLKIAIDKVVATKHKLEATVLIQSQQPFDKNIDSNVIGRLTYGENKYSSEGVAYGNEDDKTLKLDFDRETGDEELPEKGELRIDLVIPKYKINVGLDANVDFSESFKNTIEKDVSAKVPEYNFNLKKLESNVMGTTIVYSQPEEEYSKRMENDSYNLPFSAMILKIGDKMYKTVSSGGYSSNSEKGAEIGTYEAKSATFEKVKSQKDISIIPVVCNMTWNDATKIYDNNSASNSSSYNIKEADKDTTENVKYTRYFDFSDGSKGEIYRVERKDNTIKVYCKGNSELESLLMASNMYMNYNIDNKEAGHNFNIDEANMSFYKDPKDALGYIVECNNVEKDRVVELNFDTIIKQIDKFKLGSEVQISK